MTEPADESWFQHLAAAQADAGEIPFGHGSLPPPIPDDQLVPWWEWRDGRQSTKAEPQQVVVPRELRGLTFAEARRAEIPETTELVAGLVDAGTVGLIAGLPFARKSWAALELAHKVAAGTGDLFGRCPVVHGGPVVYAWQDDSLPKELERLQLYAARHAYPDELPLRFLLNEGITLPDDLGALASWSSATAPCCSWSTASTTRSVRR